MFNYAGECDGRLFSGRESDEPGMGLAFRELGAASLSGNG
jgi:hypothetical protein